MNPHNLGSLFPGLSGNGGLFLQQTGSVPRASAALSGEPDVMMISGVPEGVAPPDGVTRVGGEPGLQTAIPAPTLRGQLGVQVTIGTVTLPLWQWLLVAALLGGAGGYYLGRR